MRGQICRGKGCLFVVCINQWEAEVWCVHMSQWEAEARKCGGGVVEIWWRYGQQSFLEIYNFPHFLAVARLTTARMVGGSQWTPAPRPTQPFGTVLPIFFLYYLSDGK